MKTLISNPLIVNEEVVYKGYVVLEDDRITYVGENQPENKDFDCVVEADGMYLMPGVIDDHVHFRDPGLTHKADIFTESQAAAAGGVTSVLDMPNVVPQTTSLQALEERFALGAEKSIVNYSYFFGATNNNTELLPMLDPKRVCGVKLFMGSSTGNMLVDREESLRKVFATSPLPIMAHCEETSVINRNMQAAVERYGEDPEVIHHPEIRDAEACFESSALAVRMAKETGARLHIAHLTTARELQLLDDQPLTDADGNVAKKITAEACVAHLLFSDKDYARLGTRIKCNPAIKSEQDRAALVRALSDNRIDVIGTDHAPHLLSEKEGGCKKAVSGMPMVQFSLLSMLQSGYIEPTRIVRLMCHNPALLFAIKERGFIRVGYKADLVLVRKCEAHTLQKEEILSKCGWSPLEGTTFQWEVVRTFCNGHTIYQDRKVDTAYRGEELVFNR